MREEALAGEDVATAVNPEEWARVNARGRGERIVDVRPLFGGASGRVGGARGDAEETDERAGAGDERLARGESAGAVEDGGRPLREFDPARSGGLI